MEFFRTFYVPMLLNNIIKNQIQENSIIHVIFVKGEI
jgi:hypothetical protein